MRIVIIFLIAVLSAGCLTIDDSKYDKLYNSKFGPKENAAKAERREEQGERGKIAQAGTEVKPDVTPVAQRSIETKEEGWSLTTVKPMPKSTSTAKTEVKTVSEAVTEGRASMQPEKKKRRMKIKEMTINSGKMRYNRESGITSFMNGVEVRAEGLEVKGDRLVSKDYRDSAEVTGRVRARYDEYSLLIKCKKMLYANGMRDITAHEKVTAMMVMEDGNTLTMKADEIIFETEKSLITALKKKHRVEIVLDDVVVFSDKVVYNEQKEELVVTGNPVLKKKKSLFLADTAVLDAVEKRIRLDKNIWSKLFYSEFEDAKEKGEQIDKGN